jgi:hypothetical protein
MHSFSEEYCQANHRRHSSTLASAKSSSLLFYPFMEQKNLLVKTLISFNQGLGIMVLIKI